MSEKKKKINRILFGIGGFSVGIINGLLGAGGGMLAVPLLKKSGLKQQEAHASSLAVILPLSIFSATLYLTSGRVTLPETYPYIPAGIAGAIFGTYLLKKIPDKWLRRIFGVFMIWAGYRLLTR